MIKNCFGYLRKRFRNIKRDFMRSRKKHAELWEGEVGIFTWCMAGSVTLPSKLQHDAKNEKPRTRLSEPDTNMHPTPIWADSEWRAVVSAFTLNGLLFGAWAARVPAFKDRFDLEPSMLGLLLLALAGGAITAFPFAGAFSERWGASKLTIFCAWAYAPALVLLAFAPVPLALAGALFVFGAMHGAMDVAMNGWGAQVETRTARSTMSVFHAMFSLGAGLGAASGFVAL